MKALTFNEIMKSRSAVSDIEKFNPYHDARGRFTSAGAAGASFSANPNTKAGQMAIDRESKKNPLYAAAYGQGKTVREEAKENTEIVRSRLSNTVNPIKVEKLDIDSVMKDAGCDRATAEKAGKLAGEIFDDASRNCPQITNDVVAVTAKNGGKMYGLDFRQKQETSLARKIASDARDEGISLEKAAAGVKDSVRYTAVFETKDFAAGYQNVKQTLLDQGYTHVRSKDFFAQYKEKKSCIKSVQDVFESPSGVKFEFQFQTPETQGAKEVTHPLYEKHRSASTTTAQKERLWDIMTDVFADVPEI